MIVLNLLMPAHVHSVAFYHEILHQDPPGNAAYRSERGSRTTKLPTLEVWERLRNLETYPERQTRSSNRISLRARVTWMGNYIDGGSVTS